VTAASVATRIAGSASAGRITRRHGWTIAIYVVAIVFSIYWSTLPANFGSFNVQSLVITGLPLAFAAMAQSVVLISGGIDLSVGPLMGLTNVLAAKYMLHHGIGVAVLISAGVIVVGLLAGTITGSIIAGLKLPDIIATLAMYFFWGGLALTILPQPGGGAPSAFTNLGTGSIGGWLPIGLVIIAAVLVVVWLPLRWALPGLALYALGSDRNATFLSGVAVKRTKIFSYALGGGLAALGGLAITATTGTGNAGGGTFYTLQSIGAAVLGGVALTGGKGGLIGPIAGAFVLVLVNSVLTLFGVNGSYGQIAQGAVIVAVVMVVGLLTKTRRRQS
jgi:ribose transport system permease protein